MGPLTPAPTPVPGMASSCLCCLLKSYLAIETQISTSATCLLLPQKSAQSFGSSPEPLGSSKSGCLGRDAVPREPTSGLSWLPVARPGPDVFLLPSELSTPGSLGLGLLQSSIFFLNSQAFFYLWPPHPQKLIVSPGGSARSANTLKYLTWH